MPAKRHMLRTDTSQGVKVVLVRAKLRVVPLKQLETEVELRLESSMVAMETKLLSALEKMPAAYLVPGTIRELEKLMQPKRATWSAITIVSFSFCACKIKACQSANNNQITIDTASKFWKTSPNKAHSSDSGNAHHKNKTDTSAKTVHSTSDASDGNSSDTDSDLTVTSAPDASSVGQISSVLLLFNRARSKSEQSQKLKQDKRGLSQMDIPSKLKKSAHQNSVSLGLADRGSPQGLSGHFWWRAPSARSQTSSIR
ncbi:hypothetical protein AVEN_114666-1 [Araneus ventricosus]|uniref:Uncharacterized protein n=1 Tax=Araneus ventricosus TaxID=182803 RepID=A0A4Y2NLD4_ARAVE|nr:hypothetical protein AVEN_114666-1 [Araneus ventricosus]